MAMTMENCCALMNNGKIGVCAALFNESISCTHFSLDGVDHLGRKILICNGHFDENRKSHSAMCYGEAFRERLAEEILELL